MINPKQVDVIVPWPVHMDYPIFRYNIERFRRYFNNVYFVKTQDTMPENYFEFLMGTMRDVTWIKPPPVNGADWRNVATREVLLNHSKSEYVLFLEQDFLIKDQRLFEVIYSDLEYNTFVYIEGDRVHPAFALAPRELIDRTSMDFGVQTPQYDHFGWFFKELLPLTNYVSLEDIALHSKQDFYHMAGLTNNYWVYQLGQPFYKPEEFLVYNHLSQKVPLPQPANFRKLCEAIENKFGHANLDIFLKDFFPKEEVV